MSVVQKRAKILVKRHSIPEFKYGVIWEDFVHGHKVGRLDATSKEDVKKLMAGHKATLAIQE